MVRLDGKKSHLRKELLQKACEDTRIKFRKPLYPGKTRFGSQEKTGQRCIDLKEAIFALPDIEPSLREDDHAAANVEDNEGANSRSSWADLKRDLNHAYPILDHIIPVFKEIEQWTQIISSKRNPTLSKCRLACRRLKQHIDELEILVDGMQAGKLKSDLNDAIAGLVDAREYHMGHEYYMFLTIRVAEFLDVEVFQTIPPAEWKELRGGEVDDDGNKSPGLIANFLLEKDSISPAELAKRKAAAAPTRAGLICTALRNRLAPKTIQCLSSLHYHYAAEEKAQQSTRSASADGRAKRFAVLTTALLIEGGDRYISDSESEDELDF